MSKLFAESVQIDEERNVMVLVLPDKSVAIRGITINTDGDFTTGAVRLSSEATEIVRQILNRWHKAKKD